MPEVNTSAIENFLSKMNLYSILWALLALVICLVVVKYLLLFFKKLLSKTKLDPSLKSITFSVIKFGLYFISATIVAEVFGLPPTTFVTVCGTLGLAFSLAMQDSLSNIAGGILLLYTNPFKPGDYIESNSVGGTVDRIGLIHTSLKTVDNKKIYIPNSALSKDKIINFSAEDYRQLEIIFPISYSCDTKKAKGIIEEMVRKHPNINQDKTVFIRVWALNESSVDIIIRCWVEKADYFEVKCALLEEVKYAFDERGITIPFNQLDVHIVGEK